MTSHAEVVARAVHLAADRDEAALAAALSSRFFARLASGRIVLGAPGFVEVVSYETAISGSIGEPFVQLEDLGGGFVLRAEPEAGRAEVKPGAWLLHILDERLTAVLHFDSSAAACRSLPPRLGSAPPAEILEAAIAAANRSDLVALLSYVSEDFTLVAEPGATPVTGIPALLDLLESIAAHFDSYQLVPARIRECGGGHALIEGHVVVSANGETVRSPRAILARVESARATEWTLYETVAQAREALRGRVGGRAG